MKFRPTCANLFSPRWKNSLGVLVILSTLAFSSPVHAAQYWWDAATIGGTGNGTSTFGSGTWSTSNANWDQGNALPRVSWPTSGTNVAIFGGDSTNFGSTANVTLGSDVTVSQIVINPTGSYSYNFTGSTVTFNGTYNAATPTISSAAAINYSGNFGSKITGDLSASSGLVLALGGNPSLYSSGNSNRFALTNAANDFIGDLTIASGSFRIESTFGEYGNAANRVILNGGGIVGFTAAATYNINRELVIGSNGGTINMVDTTYNLNQAVSGSGNLSFYGGTAGFLNLTSDLSGYTGNLINQIGTTTINSTVASGGQWTVTSGTLRFGASNKIVGGPSNRGNFTINGGTLDLNGTTQSINGLAGSAGTVSSSVAGAVTLTLGSGDASASYAGTLANGHGSAVVSLTKTGSGTQSLTGANTYTGITTINGGILSTSNLKNGATASGIGASSSAATNLVLNGGTLRYTGAAQSTDRLFTVGTSGGSLDASGSGAVNFTNTGSMGFNGTGIRTLTLTGTNPGDNTLAAVIGDNSGATSLTKGGAGKWILTGANTYTGTTLVTQGTLVLSGSGSIAASATVNVQSGATLDTSAKGIYTYGSTQTVKGNGTIIGDTILAGTLAAGNSPGILTFNDDLTLASSANSIFEIQNTGLVRGTDYDGVNVGGELSYDGTLTLSLMPLVENSTYDLFSFTDYNLSSNFDSVVFSGAYTGTFAYNAGFWTATAGDQVFSFSLANGDLIISAIPEPSTTLLLTAGLMAMLFLRRRHSAS